jgi:hypothetical protein
MGGLPAKTWTCSCRRPGRDRHRGGATGCQMPRTMLCMTMVGELVGQLVAMSQQMAEAAAAADRARAELEAYRSGPWWLRLAG